MLEYLQRRVCISEGMSIVLEWVTPQAFGTQYTFDVPPCLAVDEFLSDVPEDPLNNISYLSIIHDRLDLAPGTNQYEKRLNSFYNQFIATVFFMNVGNRATNKLMNASDPQDSKIEITINGMKVIPLKGIDSPAKKLGFLQDFSGGPVCIPGYDSTFKLLDSTWQGFYNPNLNTYYGNKFSYGAFMLNKFINNDFTISYSFTDSFTNTTTLLILAQVLRSYDRTTDRVSFVSTNVVTAV